MLKKTLPFKGFCSSAKLSFYGVGYFQHIHSFTNVFFCFGLSKYTSTNAQNKKVINLIRIQKDYTSTLNICHQFFLLVKLNRNTHAHILHNCGRNKCKMGFECKFVIKF